MTGKRPGIIPARAGFTVPRQSSSRSSRDHPRSRGVYAGGGRCVLTQAGSSPLARGLPSPPQPTSAESGIIPARAGFTPMFGMAFFRTPDHPRSRGVYPGRAVACGGDGGSSPLARGLPLAAHRDDPGHGIIPARAGFTRMGGRRSSPTTDHPRSRGVYAAETAATAMTQGSSPLARGLPGSRGGVRR